MTILNQKKLRDAAYLTATGNHLTAEYNFDEFQELEEDDIWDVIWEPLENWDMKNVIEHIAQIAEEIIRRVNEIEESDAPL